MTFTIELPEELASPLTAILPEEERDRFVVSAVTEALRTRRREDDARLAAFLNAELDPENESERDSAECVAVVEEGLEEVEAGCNLVHFEEVRRQWEAEKTA